MPVIIEAGDYRAWVEATPETAPKFFKPYAAEFMTARAQPLPPRVKNEKLPAKKRADEKVGRSNLF